MNDRAVIEPAEIKGSRLPELIALASEEVPAVTIRKESGAWTVGELAGMVPTYLMRDVINPAPPAADLHIPGRDGAAASPLARRRIAPSVAKTLQARTLPRGIAGTLPCPARRLYP